MFEFFEKIAEGIGFKLVSNFSEKVIDWIKEIRENAENKEDDNIATSGYGSKVATSGNESQVATSGNWSKVATSGNWSKVATSGNESKVATSGNWSKVATSGNESKVATSGNWSQVATSGNWSQVATSGYGSKVATSGHESQVAIEGEYSVGFACGYNSIIKAKKGTWISLAEYERNNNGDIIPIFAKSAQIENKNYKDHNGKTLKENIYYILWKKEFHIVDELDGVKTIRLSEKKIDSINIIKAIDIDDILDKEPKEIYIAKEESLSAHGYTAREAIEDLALKKLDNINIDEIVSKIKETGKVTRSQYRAITGACSFGTNKFCEKHNIQNLEEIELDELRKILTLDNYGAKKFWELIDKEEKNVN